MAAKINGEAMLTACGASYQAVQQWKRKGRFVMPRGYRFVAGLGGTSYWGFVTESRQAIMVAFRGTSSLFDLLTDFNWGLVPYPFAPASGSVHRGFTELYERQLRSQLFDALGKLSSRKRLLLTGHSLGGALATLSALDMVQNTRFRSPWVYTFGSPKVGDGQFASAYSRSISVSRRVANVHDIVPLFPPSAVHASYVHVNTETKVISRVTGVLHNHQIRSYAMALASRYPALYKRLYELNPGFLP